jgi:hypothetical protein
VWSKCKSRIRPEGVNVAYDNGAMAAVATMPLLNVKMNLSAASQESKYTTEYSYGVFLRTYTIDISGA